MNVQLALDTIGDLDGGMARAVIDRNLELALRDCEDRGQDDGKPRKVLIEVEFVKLNDNQVSIDVSCGMKLPAMRPKATIANLEFSAGQPRLMFQAMAPEDPSQRTIDERIKE